MRYIKKNCTYFNLYEQRNYFLLLLSSRLSWYLLYLYKILKKPKKKKYSWAAVQYWYVFFSPKWYSIGCSRSQAPMRLFLCIPPPQRFKEGRGVILTSHIWTISKRRRDTCTTTRQCRGWLGVWAVEIWSFSFLRRGLKTRQPPPRYFSQRVTGKGARIRTRWQYILRLIL